LGGCVLSGGGRGDELKDGVGRRGSGRCDHGRLGDGDGLGGGSGRRGDDRRRDELRSNGG